MGADDLQPERANTNESLAVERAKTDAAFAEKAAVEEKSDAVIGRMRKKADEVLTAARAEADDKMRDGSASDQAATAERRLLEDQTLEIERSRADLIVSRERELSERVFARLLPLEREETDQHLLVERARSDAALATRDDFLGMVSHDLRGLLTGIVLSSTWIGEQAVEGTTNVELDERGQHIRFAVERIERSAARMGRLIGDLVDVASIDAGKLSVVLAKADARDVVLEAVRTWESQALAKGLSLEALVQRPLVGAFDGERILQILGNLITNAIKFSPNGSSIQVGACEIEGEICFSVRDSGVGIASDNLDAIFERFWQVGKNDRRGLGLGLFISRSLVEAHGGRIWVESEAGAGSTFFFTVPGDTLTAG